MPTFTRIPHVVAVVVLTALAACQPQTEEAAPVEPVSAAPPPPEDAMRFMALSQTAQAVTGDVAFMTGPRLNPDDPPAMRIKSNTGVTYDTVLQPGGADEAPVIDWEYVFGLPVVTAPNPPPGAPNVELHIVTQERIPDGAPAGGYCGDEPATALALATNLSVDGQPRMSIAAFRGEWPPKDESSLCDVFSYRPPQR